MSIHVFGSNPAEVNAGIVISADRILLIDTGSGPEQAQAILSTVHELAMSAGLATAASPIIVPITVINTHDHWDHYFGNATVFAAGITDFRASSSFVSQQEASTWIQLADLMETAPDIALPPEPTELVVPVQAVFDGQRLDCAEHDVEFIELSGHTDTDLAIRVDDVVFLGDLIEEGAPPQCGEDAVPGDWIASLRHVLETTTATTFIPGHGLPMDRTTVALQLSDLETMVTQRTAPTDLPSRFMVPTEQRPALPRIITVAS